MGPIKKTLRKMLREADRRDNLIGRMYREAIRSKRQHRFDRYAASEIRQHVVLFEAFNGFKYTDSPRAVYEYMQANDEFSGYRFIWAFRDRVMEDFRYLDMNPCTELVRWGSEEYYAAYAKAKYWFTNTRIPEAIRRRDGQVYVQCWHGTPLKKLGCDIPASTEEERETTRAVIHKDVSRYSVLLSPSPYYTKCMTSALDLRALGQEGIVLEAGYPRNDSIINAADEDAERVRRELGIPEDGRVILYAPTYRENQRDGMKGYRYKEALDLKRLLEEIGAGAETWACEAAAGAGGETGADAGTHIAAANAGAETCDWYILFRAHHFIAEQFDFAGCGGHVIDVSRYPEVNDLYIASDLLITDYSSVFFDYGILRRPMIFYMYDLDVYKDELRGLYMDLSELPGPVVRTQEELTEKIRGLDEWTCTDDYLQKYDDFVAKFAPYEDGQSAARVVRAVFGSDAAE